jgi:hypothetical protein
MNHPRLTIFKLVSRRLSVFILLAVSAAAAFATLGDGRKKASAAPRAFLSSKTVNNGFFSLKSGYTFRGNQVISNDKKYINLNTVVTIQKGNTTYVLPLHKKVLLNNVKIELGNRQFNH